MGSDVRKLTFCVCVCVCVCVRERERETERGGEVSSRRIEQSNSKSDHLPPYTARVLKMRGALSPHPYTPTWRDS